MATLSSTNLALITAISPFGAAALTALFMYLIERDKSLKAKREKQQNILSLLLQEVQFTTHELEVEYKGIGAVIENNCAHFASMLENLILSLGGSLSIGTRIIINNYEHLPKDLQEDLITYYRQLIDMRKRCEGALASVENLDKERIDPLFVLAIQKMVCEYLRGCHNFLINVAKHKKDIKSVVHHRERLEHFEAEHIIIEHKCKKN